MANTRYFAVTGGKLHLSGCGYLKMRRIGASHVAAHHVSKLDGMSTGEVVANYGELCCSCCIGGPKSTVKLNDQDIAKMNAKPKAKKPWLTDTIILSLEKLLDQAEDLGDFETARSIYAAILKRKTVLKSQA
jgi:hypothetical protein